MYVRQIVECGGISRIEYGYEPEEEFVEDDSETIYSPTYCKECDFYVQGKCQLANKLISQDNLACPDLQITYPF